MVRSASYVRALVTRVETSFLGRDPMVAFIQDTAAGWRRAPLPTYAEVQFRPAS